MLLRNAAGLFDSSPLYKCGSGTHPGACVMGAPGKLAAGQILRDQTAHTRRD